jgi:hypothetical protein
MAEDLRRDDRRGRHRQAFHDAADDGVAVEGLADRARTRASLNGFLPSGLPALSVTNGGLSRDWSICQKIVRHDTVCSILNLGSA